MTTTPEHDQRIAKMTFASVYPHYLKKIESKGRKEVELQQVIEWLTGYDFTEQKFHIDQKSTFEIFFNSAQLHINSHLIKGVICGYRIEDIENPLTRKVRFLDKLVDELAKGRKIDKIFRI